MSSGHQQHSWDPPLPPPPPPPHHKCADRQQKSPNHLNNTHSGTTETTTICRNSSGEKDNPRLRPEPADSHLSINSPSNRPPPPLRPPLPTLLRPTQVSEAFLLDTVSSTGVAAAAKTEMSHPRLPCDSSQLDSFIPAPNIHPIRHLLGQRPTTSLPPLPNPAATSSDMRKEANSGTGEESSCSKGNGIAAGDSQHSALPPKKGVPNKGDPLPLPPPPPSQALECGRMGRRRCSTLFRDRFRYFIMVLGTLCLTAIFSNMLTLNFTLICMEKKNGSSHGETGELATTAHTQPVHEYTTVEKAVFQWSVAIAAMLATFPFSWLCTHYGARWIFFFTGVSAGLANGVIPLAAKLGVEWMLFARLIQGLAYASDFAVIGVICTRWSPLTENAKFLSWLTCFSALSSFITNAVSGVICDHFGWPWVHYSHCAVTLVLFSAWLFFYTDDPRHNYFVSSKELACIHRDKSEAHCNHEPFVPYKEIATDKVVWTVWANAFAVILSEFFLFIYAPTYIKNVLHYGATETGFLGSLTSAVHIPFKLICGYMSDTFHCVSEYYKLRLYNSLALLLPAGMYIYLCYVPTSSPWVTVVLFASVQAALGFNCGGYYKCSALVSRQYAEFVIALTQFIKCAVFLVAPLLYFIFIHNESSAIQWHIIFYIIAGTLIGANILFLIYATERPCKFTEITSRNRISVEDIEEEKKRGSSQSQKQVFV